jgi:hypothetical protein
MRPASREHDVTEGELGRGQLDDLAVAAHARDRCGHLAKGLHRALGTVLLEDADGGVQHEDHQDGHGVGDLAEGARIRGRRAGARMRKSLELVGDHAEYRVLLALGERVGPVLFLAAVRFLTREALAHDRGDRVRPLQGACGGVHHLGSLGLLVDETCALCHRVLLHGLQDVGDLKVSRARYLADRAGT